MIIELDFSRCELLFGNIDGDEDGVRAIRTSPTKDPLTLAKLNTKMKLRGSIALGGKRRVLDSLNQVYMEDETVDDTWDFCILVLEDEHAEKKLKEMDLAWLECGKGDYLNYKKGDVAAIYGHPQIGREEKRPLRHSWGKELEGSKKNPDSLYFEYDSLECSSGSPVVGRGSENGTSYAVKGIHTRAEGTRFKKNRAQGLKGLSNWISLDPIPK